MVTHMRSFAELGTAAMVTIAVVACGGSLDRVVGPAPELKYEEWEVDEIPSVDPPPPVEVVAEQGHIQISAYAAADCFGSFYFPDLAVPAPSKAVLILDARQHEDTGCPSLFRAFRYKATILKLKAGEYELEVQHFGDALRPDGTVLDTLVTVE